jgi:hypothetical protein
LTNVKISEWLHLFYLFQFKISFHEHNLKPILADYIYHKNKKGKPSEKDLPLLKNDIPNNLYPQKPVIDSKKTAIVAKANPFPNNFFIQFPPLIDMCRIIVDI